MYSSTLLGVRVDFEGFGFREARVPIRTTGGGTFYRRIFVGMPRVPKKFLKTVFFLYKTKEDAKNATDPGGTGFIVQIPSSIRGQSHTYLVTNWHVAVNRGYPVVRLEAKSGEPEIFDFDCADWDFLIDYDIAVASVALDPMKHDVFAIPIGCFMQEQYAKEHDVGAGDDVFMLGLLIDRHGPDRNIPALRFGHISMAPTPMVQENGRQARSYCLDMHSRQGFSGSPVFAYRTPGFDLEELLDDEGMSVLKSGASLLSLLGIHWGQFPERWEINADGNMKFQDQGATQQALISGDAYIKGLSGMTCVLPAWSILEVLDMPKIKQVRDKEDNHLRQVHGDDPVPEASNVEEDPRNDGDAVLSRMLNTPPKPHD